LQALSERLAAQLRVRHAEDPTGRKQRSGHDGGVATRRFRATPGLHKFFNVALTTRAMAIEREKALDARCNDYDTNPIELQRPLVRLVTPLTAAGH
jgi:CheY-like chemotaxis protein